MNARKGTRRPKAPAPPEVASGAEERERARACYGRRAWAEAHRWFSLADARAPLGPPDLESYAFAADLSGREGDFLVIMERLYQLQVEAGEETRAARAACWMGMRLSALGEMGRASGWLARAERLVEQSDCVERGYLLLPAIHRGLAAGDLEAACRAAVDAIAIGDRFRDPDLGAFARCLHGRALIRQGQVARAMALLDEAMLAVMNGEVSPVLTGLIYCSAIAVCQQVYLVDRSREWTAALAGWCDAQPELVPFSGICLVHRAELMQLGGAWPEAIDEARRATARVQVRSDPRTAADSLYQQAEVHRLRGDFTAAERAYRDASELGRDAQPGVALLRLSQGRGGDAASAIRRVLGATRDRLQRARLLPAAVEILLATGDLEEARRASGELTEMAGDFGTEVLGAMAAQAEGAVAIADRHPEAALEPLRRALGVWRQVGAPYIAARVRLLLASACRAVGDDDTARLELELAAEVFERLGAAPDLAALSQVVIEQFEEPPPFVPRKKGAVPARLPLTRIAAAIYCERDGQKAILIGKGGAKLKEIGTGARRQIESLLGTRVYLQLHVIVEPGWRESKSFVESLDWRNQLERLATNRITEQAPDDEDPTRKSS